MATWLTAELVGDGAPSGGSGFGQLTRVTSGVNLPSLEVIMSRPEFHRSGRRYASTSGHWQNSV